MTIFIKQIHDLAEADWSTWLEIQSTSPLYASPYFRPEFTQSVAAVRSDVEVAVFYDGAKVMGFLPFQRGTLSLGKPIGGKMSDYHGPILATGAEFDPLGFLTASGLATWDFDHLVLNTHSLSRFITLRDQSPVMDLTDGYEAYAQQRRAAGSDAVHRQGQKGRKLAREVGPIEFTFSADDDDAYRLLLKWKSEQYLRTGLTDVFSFPWTLELLAKLRGFRGDGFFAPLSVLRAGDQVAAVCLSICSRGTLHAWFNAYNPELSHYSPGIGLFVAMAQQAEQLGIRTIDLGRGTERYKWSLASRSIPLCEGSFSRRSLATLLRSSWRRTRDWVNRSPLAGGTKLLRPLREWIAYQ